jgi:hypothetical protein
MFKGVKFVIKDDHTKLGLVRLLSFHILYITPSRGDYRAEHGPRGGRPPENDQ